MNPKPRISGHLLIIAFFILSNLSVHSQVNLTSSNLPIVIIETNDQAIQDEMKIIAHLGIIDNGFGSQNNINDPFNDYDGKIAIEIRGSSSSMFPKKSYGFETKDQIEEDMDVSLLGLPAEEDWILYAPYSDKSLIRNVLTYEITNLLGRYASKTRFCELVLNGEYVGVYVLMEKIKRDINRVDISTLSPDEITGDDLTGGYILKIDKNTGSGYEFAWNSPHPPLGNVNRIISFLYHYPKYDEIVDEQKNYIKNYFMEFEQVLKSAQFADPENGYAKYIDTDSFIDFLIINELTKNVDGYRLSSFFYKDKASKGGKLNAGPVWDFNLALGNADYCEGGEIFGYCYDFNFICPNDNWLVPFWWKKLRQDVKFEQKLKMRWTTLRESVLSTENLFSMIADQVEYLDESQKRNFQKWPILNQYVWPNNYVGNTYASEILYLKNWLEARVNWLDMQLTTVISGMENKYENNIQVYPNPFKGHVTFHLTDLPYDLVQVCIVDQMGRKVYSKHWNTGEKNIQWAIEQPGLYHYSIMAGGKIISKGSILNDG